MEEKERLYKKAKVEGPARLSFAQLMLVRSYLHYEIGKDKLAGLEDEKLLKFLKKIEREIDKKVWEKV